MKFTPAAAISTSTWPGPGWGVSTSVTVSTSGPPVCRTCIACMCRHPSRLSQPCSGTPQGKRTRPAGGVMELLEAGARQLDRVERARRLDRPVEVLRRAIRRVIPPGPVADALHGTWLGHPLHPALTDVPVGAWIGAAVLDAVPGQETAATALVGLGLAGAVPSALTGWTDWAAAGPAAERLGLWHGLANLAAATAYAASLVARLKGRHGTGRLLGGLGLTPASVGAHLGGPLSYPSGTRVNH